MNDIAHIGIILIFMVVAGAWRWFDGTNGIFFGVKMPTGVRNAITVLIALGAAFYAIGFAYWTMWAAGVAALSIVMGYTKWKSPTWQAVRFGVPGLLVVLPFVGVCAYLAYKINHDTASFYLFYRTAYWIAVDNPLLFAYPFACAAAGVSYSILKEDRARLVLGAVVIGGQSWL